MLKRILAAVGIVLLGFIAVVALALFEFRQVGNAIEQESSITVPFYRAATQVSEAAQHLERLVGAGFLATSKAGLAAVKEEAATASQELAVAIKGLNSERFTSLLEHPLFADVTTSTNHPARPATNEVLTVGQLLATLSAARRNWRPLRSTQLTWPPNSSPCTKI